MKIFRLRYLLFALAVAMAGCSSKPRNGEGTQAPGIQPKAAHSEGMPAPSSGTDLKFTIPQDWISETPATSSRKAQYKLPRAEGDSEDAQLVIYYFGGGGGTPQANADRWIGEFNGPDGKPASGAAKVTHRTINGIHLTLVDVSGTYSSSMGSMKDERPKSGIRLLGAIAEAGNGPWFIKLTGPAKTVARWEPSFQSFLNSIKQED